MRSPDAQINRNSNKTDLQKQDGNISCECSYIVVLRVCLDSFRTKHLLLSFVKWGEFVSMLGQHIQHSGIDVGSQSG